MAVPQPTTVNPLGFFVRAPGALGIPSPLVPDNIDPATRDFPSLFIGLDVIDAQVILALSTVRASGAAVQEDGIDDLPPKMEASLQNDLEGAVRTALGRLIRNGDWVMKLRFLIS